MVVNTVGDFEVQVEELAEQVGLGVEAVGGEDGGVEGGVGILEGVLAGQLERAIRDPANAIGGTFKTGPIHDGRPCRQLLDYEPSIAVSGYHLRHRIRMLRRAVA